MKEVGSMFRGIRACTALARRTKFNGAFERSASIE